MSYNLKLSYDKIIHYIDNVSKEDVEIVLDGKTEIIKKPTQVTISRYFFRNFKCLMCSRCCSKVRFYNCYDEVEFLGEFKKLYPDEVPLFEKSELKLNGNSYNLYNRKHRDVEGCHYLSKAGCGIHLLNPIHCRVPLVKIKRVKDRTYLSKEQYGRNWQFGCEAVFPGELSVDNVTADEKNTLNRILKVSESYNIKTWLPEILDYLNTTKEPKSIIFQNTSTNLSKYFEME